MYCYLSNVYVVYILCGHIVYPIDYHGQFFKGVENVLDQSCLRPDMYTSLVFVGLQFSLNMADCRVDKVDQVCW